MFLLLRLLLAHFFADFILQTKPVYEAKKKNLRGASLHYFIILVTFLIISFPYLRFIGCWIVIIFTWIAHIIQDEIKLRKLHSIKTTFLNFILDQFIHVILLFPILFFDFSYQPLFSQSILAKIYNNNTVIIILIGYIINIFVGLRLWEAFKVSFYRNYFGRNPVLIDTKFRVELYEMFERFIITTSFLHTHFLPLLLIPVVFRVLNKRLTSSVSIIFNLLYSALIGLFLKQFIL